MLGVANFYFGMQKAHHDFCWALPSFIVQVWLKFSVHATMTADCVVAAWTSLITWLKQIQHLLCCVTRWSVNTLLRLIYPFCKLFLLTDLVLGKDTDSVKELTGQYPYKQNAMCSWLKPGWVRKKKCIQIRCSHALLLLSVFSCPKYRMNSVLIFLDLMVAIHYCSSK